VRRRADRTLRLGRADVRPDVGAVVNLGQGLVIAAAGAAAGFINSVAGGGSLITFPTLVAVGYKALAANVTNTVGLISGSMSGAWAYRVELEGARARLTELGITVVAGSLAGTGLLLLSPDKLFRSIIPYLVLAACVLLFFQPRLSVWVRNRAESRGKPHRKGLHVAVFIAGAYGSYFGAALGVLLIALLGMFLAETMHRLNAYKNVLAATANLTGAIVYAIAAPVHWDVALLLAVSSTAGGMCSSVARKLPTSLYRRVVLLVGVIAGIRLLFS
jgi:uncharacterized membrane protein YfcA